MARALVLRLELPRSGIFNHAPLVGPGDAGVAGAAGEPVVAGVGIISPAESYPHKVLINAALRGSRLNMPLQGLYPPCTWSSNENGRLCPALNCGISEYLHT